MQRYQGLLSAEVFLFKLLHQLQPFTSLVHHLLFKLRLLIAVKRLELVEFLAFNGLQRWLLLKQRLELSRRSMQLIQLTG
ncbi:hypothetical protein D3C76_1218560 [compost metagenome]